MTTTAQELTNILEAMMPKPCKELNDHSVFLACVEQYVTENPTVAALITQFVARGIEKSREMLLEQSSDTEAALGLYMHDRFGKGRVKKLTEIDSFVIEKIKKWNHKRFLNWNWLYENLEGIEEKKDG